MTSQHATASANAPAPTGVARGPGTSGHRYRWKGRGTPELPDAGDVRNALRSQRQRISIVASQIRALTIRRSHLLAHALQDGLTVTVLADAAGLPRRVVREAGISLAGQHPPGLAAQEHLLTISAVQAEIAALEQSRAEMEQTRLKHLAAAHHRRIIDHFELASLTGLTPDHIRKMTRGTHSGDESPGC